MRSRPYAIAALGLTAFAAPVYGAEPESVTTRFETENNAAGIVMGGWEVRSSAMLRGGYDSNANQASSSPKGSPLIALRGSLEAARQLGAAQLAGSFAAEQTWRVAASEQDTLTASANLRGTIYVGDQMSLRGAIGIERGAEATQAAENGLVNSGVVDPYTNRPRYTRVPVELGLSQDVGSYFWDASVISTATHFDRLRTVSGTTVPQDYRNGWDHAAQARLGVRIAEGYGVFARAEANIRRFDDPSADNDGLRLTGGVEFELTRILTGEITAGWARQSYAVSSKANSDLIYGAGLTWYANPLVSVTLDAEREFTAEQNLDALGAATSVPVLQDSVQLTLEVEPMRRWLVTGRAKYLQTTSENGARDSEIIELGLGSTWALTRSMRLNAEYAYATSNATFAGDIVRNLVTVGLTAQY